MIAGEKICRRPKSFCITAFALCSSLYLSGCGAPDAQARPLGAANWFAYDRGAFGVKLPGTLIFTDYATLTGAFSLVTKCPDGETVSLCIVPSTSIHLVDRELAIGKANLASWSYQNMFPVFRDMKPVLTVADAKNLSKGLVLVSPITLASKHVEGQVWRLSRVYAVAYLLVIANSAESATDIADQVHASLVEKQEPRFPPDRPATGLDAPVPEDWPLVVDDETKRYWNSHTGQAFIMISKGIPATGSDSLWGYGLKEDIAKAAIIIAESLSGRKPEVKTSSLMFEPRLWTIISRAQGVVEYSQGKYSVEMDYWVDPRTKRFHRVYIGGLEEPDLQAARKIRDGLRFVWADKPLPPDAKAAPANKL